MTDDPKLTPANENPWYVLMTIWGEQDGDQIDWDLHEKNKDTWNRFWAEEINTNWAKQDGTTPDPITALEEHELKDLKIEFEKRGLALPTKENAQLIDCNETDFSFRLIAMGLVFPVKASFRDAAFGRATE